MKFLYGNKAIGLIFISLLSGIFLFANEWMWHGSFPWIYSNQDQEWSYWRTGKDGRFYKWSQSSGGWQIYNDGEGQWTSLTAPDLNVTKWQFWEENPKPYGGAYTLGKIKDAVLNSQSYLDLSYQRIQDLTPVGEALHLRQLFLQANQISDLTPLQNLKGLEVLNLNSNKISDLGSLSNLLELKELYLDDNNLTDLTPVAGLGRLVRLSLSDLNLVSVEALKDLRLLEELHLRANSLTSIEPLAQLRKMKFWILVGIQFLTYLL